MKHLAFPFLAATLLALGACGPDKDPLPPVTDTGPDATDVHVPDADIGPDAVAGPTIKMWFGVRDGTKGENEDTVSLFPEDEPLQYAGGDFNVDIVVETTGVTTGRKVRLYVDGGFLFDQDVVTITEPGGTTFKGAALKASTAAGYEVRVEVTTVDNVTVEAKKTVIVQTDSCIIELSPTTEDGCLTQDADPDTDGLQVRFTVSHVWAQCTRAQITYTLGAADPVTMDPVDLDAAGAAEFVVHVGDAGVDVEDSIQVTASVLHPTSTDLDGTTSATYTIDNVVPAVTITQPDPQILTELNLQLDDGGDPSDGIQYDVIGTVTGLAAGDLLSLWLDDVDTGITTNPLDGAFIFDNVTFVQNAPVKIGVVASDSCQNPGLDEVTISVLSGLSEMSIESPTVAEVLYAKDDQDAATALDFETGFTVKSTAVIEGSTLTVSCKAQNGGTSYYDVGSRTIAAGEVDADDLYLVAVVLETGIISTQALCRASVDLPNPSLSTDVPITIALPAPSLSLTSPAADAKLNSTTVTFAGQASNLDGLGITARVVELGCETSGGTIAAGQFTAVLDLATDCPALVDGAYTLEIDATDTLGNVVSEIGAGAPQVSVSFDTVAPTFSVTAPELALDPLGNPAHADTNDTKPGYQTVVTVAMGGETDADGAEICATLTGAAGVTDLGCMAVDAAGFTATWTDVTLSPQDNTLDVTGTDAYGNAGAPVQAVINLNLDLPNVSITDPSATNTVTAAATYDFTVQVTDLTTGAPIAGATVDLLRQGQATGVVATDTGDGTYTFASVDLIPANQQLEFQAVATVQGAENGSPSKYVTYKTLQPVIDQLSDVNGLIPADHVYNLNDGACAGTDQDCTLDISAVITDAEAGSTAELDVDCGGGVATYQDVIGSDLSATFDAVLLTHGGSCGLTPKITGTVLTVSVDRVAPVINGFVAPSGDTLIYLQDQLPATPEMEYALAVNLGGVEQDQLVYVTMTYTDPTDQTEKTTAPWSHPIPADVADDAEYVADFEDAPGAGYVVYPEGVVELSAVVTDKAGNDATLKKVITVQSEAPGVLLSFPFYLGDDPCDGANPCDEGATCNQGTCWTTWGNLDTAQVKLTVTGMINTTDNVRICSDHPSLAATSPACTSTGSYYEVTKVSVSTAAPFITLSGLPDGFQTLVAEMQPDVTDPWLSSAGQTEFESGQSRQVYVDTQDPTVTGLDIPSDLVPSLVVPQGFDHVLCSQEQEPDSNIFHVEVTADEDGDVEIMVNDTLRAEGTVIADVPTVLDVVLDEDDNHIYAIVSDLAGNLSPLPETNPGFVVSLDAWVDTSQPSLAFSNPSDSSVTLADANFNVTLSSDKDQGQVTLYDSPTAPATAIGPISVSGGQANFSDAEYGILTDGDHDLTAYVTGPYGNQNSAQASFAVDRTAPTLQIGSPASGTNYTADQDSQAPGFQIPVEFSTGTGAQTWEIWVTSGCDDAWQGCDVDSTLVASGAVTNPDGSEGTKSLTMPIQSAQSYMQVTVIAYDAVQNEASETINVSFDIAACVVAITDLPQGSWFNASACAPAASCAQASVDLTASFFACGAVDVLVLSDGNTDSDLAEFLGPGTATFTVTLVDGVQADFELMAFVDGEEVGSSGVQSRGVDFTLPVVAFQAATVSTSTGGSFDTPGDGATVTYNQSQDALGNPGFQGYLSLTVTDTNAEGGSLTSLTGDVGGSVSPLSPSNETIPVSLDDPSPVQIVLENVTYTSQATTIVTATAVDAAGNSGSASFTATVDIVAPDAISLQNTGGLVADGDVDTRLPAVTLRWTAVGDNGSTGDPAASYDVRYSGSPITTDDEFDDACPVAALSGVSDGLLHSAPFPAPGAVGVDEVYTVSGPDPRPADVLINGQACKFAPQTDGSSYYLAVKASDAAGNWSSLGADSSVEANQLQVTEARIELTAAFTAATGLSTAFLTAYVAVVGDVNSDGKDDFVFGFGPSDGLCLFLGSDYTGNVPIDTASGATHQCAAGATSILGILPAAEADEGKELASSFTGLGDVNGDGIDDFLVTGKISGAGFAAVYLGVQTTGPDLSNPNLIIRGIDAVSNAYFGAGAAGNFNGDGIQGNPIHDIVIGEPATARAHVILGNASWAAAGATPTHKVIDLKVQADFDANVGLTIVAQDSSWFFGDRSQSAGDVLPTPPGSAAATDDLLILVSNLADPRLVVIPGRDVTAPGSTVTITDLSGTLTAEDQLSVHLRQDQPAQSGFGVSIQGGVDVTGDGTPDVIVVNSNRASSGAGNDGKAVFIFDGSKFAGAVGGELRVNSSGAMIGNAWKGDNGYVLFADPNPEFRCVWSVGDHDGWMTGGSATPDLFVGHSSYSSGEFRVNHAYTPQAGDLTPALELGLFPYADSPIVNSFSPGSFAIGITGDGGDVTGDQVGDMVLGTGQAEVIIMR